MNKRYVVFDYPDYVRVVGDRINPLNLPELKNRLQYGNPRDLIVRELKEDVNVPNFIAEYELEKIPNRRGWYYGVSLVDYVEKELCGEKV